MGLIGLIGLCVIALMLTAEGASTASEAPDAEMLLDRFRLVDWDAKAVGQNKDLADESWKARIEVENSLISIGKPALPALIEACKDSSGHVRLLAAYVLGCINDRSAIPDLMRIAGKDPYAPARIAAIEALGRLGAKEALSVVQGATEDKNRYVRNAASWEQPRVMKGEAVGQTLREMVVSNFDANRVDAAVVGKSAPDFELMDSGGKTVRLSDFRGKKNAIIVFMLADW